MNISTFCQVSDTPKFQQNRVKFLTSSRDEMCSAWKWWNLSDTILYGVKRSSLYHASPGHLMTNQDVQFCSKYYRPKCHANAFKFTISPLAIAFILNQHKSFNTTRSFQIWNWILFPWVNKQASVTDIWTTGIWLSETSLASLTHDVSQIEPGTRAN